MELLIVYDNTAMREGLECGHGFAAVVSAHGRRFLFDTGADGAALLRNLKRLGVTPAEIEFVFLSHSDSDHAGGLREFLAARPVRVYAPASFAGSEYCDRGMDAIFISAPQELAPGLYSTGELTGYDDKGVNQPRKNEHALVAAVTGGTAVVVGCGHPGVREILAAAARHGRPRALLGGLHGFDDFAALEGLDVVCPTHCTTHKDEIAKIFSCKCLRGGVGAALAYE